jgi:NMD protein affecting ribosome stability and mRNA decay
MSTKAHSKALIRAHARAGTSTGKTRRAESGGRPPEPSVCERCGAVFQKRVWRSGRPASDALLARATWGTCPACAQRREGTYVGRVRILCGASFANEDRIRRRIDNVAAWAEAAHPEHRIVSVDRDGDAIEVLTTSQKLAHRVAHELKKLLRGTVTYRWSDDGSLFATWAPARAGGTTRPRTTTHSSRRSRGATEDRQAP